MNLDKCLIEAIASELKKYQTVQKAVLFGSRARGDNTERSDYDVAVYGNVSDKDKTSLRYYCNEESPTLHEIDLIFMCEKHEKNFTENIEKEGITIYDAEN